MYTIRRKENPMKVAISCTLILGMASLAHAVAAFYDFETTPATAGVAFNPQFPGSLTTLSIINTGITMTITRADNSGPEISSFDILELSTWSPGPPASWGNRALSPFNDSSQNAFVFRFSQPVSFFSIEVGDYGVDNDTLTVSGYSGNDNTSSLLDSNVVNYGLATFPTLSTGQINSAVGFQSIYVMGGSPGFQNSLYYDNVHVETATVPEPATLTVVGLGLAAIIRRRKVK